jgi:D-3-phosphoglycerate dehydrogenase / 2-oxoglutarate reductase
MHKVVLVGNRLFMKFPDLSFFHERVREADATIVSTEGMADREILNELRDAAAIVVIGHPITREMITTAVSCRFIMTASVGYDVVDLAAATERSIPVSNCPVYCSEDVAEHALTLTLAVARKIHELISHTRGGGWQYKQAKPIRMFRNSTQGILGLGRIGRHLARKALALGMRVVAYDPYVDDDIFALLGVERVYDLEPFLEQLDYLSLHCPLTAETRHIIDAAALERMRSTAVIVNTARGALIDRSALEDALATGRIGGAAVDVLEEEPPAGDEPILNLPNAIVTPHIAWYSEESHQRNMEQAMDELVRVLQGKRPRYVVNPEIFSRRRNENTNETT